jgi:hypothetical protein
VLTRTFVGMDNGTSGALAVIRDGMWTENFTAKDWYTKVVPDYTKTPRDVRLIDMFKLCELLNTYVPHGTTVYLERPAINPGWDLIRNLSAARAHESTINAIEWCDLQYKVITSDDWQRVLLPGVKGREELKRAANEFVRKEYPLVTEAHKDGDALCIAHFAKLGCPSAVPAVVKRRGRKRKASV